MKKIRKSIKLELFAMFGWSVALVLLLSGCSTLSSIGLPFGAQNNTIIQPAKEFSDLPGQSLATSRELAIEPMTLHLIEIGDTILLEPVKFEATIRLPGDQTVQPDGFISLGEFGRLYAKNKTIEQIRDEAQVLINAHLQQDLQQAYNVERAERLQNQAAAGNGSAEDRQLRETQEQEQLLALQRRLGESILRNEVSARLISWDSKKIYVLGEVNSPGSFQYTGNQTALDGIIEAGGLTNRANRHEIIVARATPCNSCRIVMKICYDQIVQLGDASTNYQLQPGDRVFVPSMTFSDDLKQTFRGKRYKHCPRCAPCPQPCNLPVGCE